MMLSVNIFFLTGCHIDITVITPVFNKGKVIFFVASRAHHADIGGILPGKLDGACLTYFIHRRLGSMPPHSKSLSEEGAAIISFKLVENGVFQTEGITRILYEEPAKYPNCSGTRCLR
jgi:5-oxoprolinase (ATP-hydrolysing)